MLRAIERTPVAVDDGYELPDLAELLNRPAWHADALCREYTDEVTWFPSRGRSARPAVDICSCCLVQAECRQWALDRRVADGIWGGLTLAQRRRLTAPAAA
jgi:WhiB family redox-sensing transcriptional regulator